MLDRIRTRSFHRAAVAATAGAAMCLAAPAAAQAAVTHGFDPHPTLGPIYVVSGDAGPNTITLRCSGGRLIVNGAVTAARCDGSVDLAVGGKGGNDRIDISGLGTAPRRPFGQIRGVQGDLGHDRILGSRFREQLNGDTPAAPGRVTATIGSMAGAATTRSTGNRVVTGCAEAAATTGWPGTATATG